jgi:hypothetical protein
LRVSRMILPEGVWIASFAGFDAAATADDDDADDGAVPVFDDAPADPDDDAADPLADPLAMLTKLMADVGRASGFAPAPEAPPNGADAACGDPRSVAGCCRTQKTKVLLAARRAHCGCATYRSCRCACGVGCRVRNAYGGFAPVWNSGSARASGCGFDFIECCYSCQLSLSQRRRWG